MILTRSYMSLHHKKHTEKEGTPLTRASAAVAAEACFPVQTRTKSLLSRAADFSLTRPQPVNEVLTLFALALSYFRRHLGFANNVNARVTQRCCFINNGNRRDNVGETRHCHSPQCGGAQQRFQDEVRRAYWLLWQCRHKLFCH